MRSCSTWATNPQRSDADGANAVSVRKRGDEPQRASELRLLPQQADNGVNINEIRHPPGGHH